MKKSTLYLVALYCAVGMVANITACRIVAPFGFSTDVGTLLFPFVFILKDVIQRTRGLEVTQSAIWASTLCNAFMFAAIAVTAFLPADMAVGPQTEFGSVLLPAGRIMVASIISLSIVNLVDAKVYEAVAKRHGRGAVAAAASNVVSIPLDSALVVLISWVGVLPMGSMVDMIIMNCIVKFVMTFVFLPVTRKRREAVTEVAA